MKRPLLIALALAILGGCNRSGIAASQAGSADVVKAIVTSGPAIGTTNRLKKWRSEDGTIALNYPASLTPTQDFSATYFTPEGWRATFDGASVGPGAGLVRFSAESFRAGDQPLVITTILQLGTSQDLAVVADCLTRGLSGGNGSKKEGRTISGTRFTVYRNGDAGMSHQMSSIDMRAVRGGKCIAIDHIVSSAPAPAAIANSSQRAHSHVEQDIDTVLSSLTFK